MILALRRHFALSTKPAARNFLQQQAKFDDFIDCYNETRTHLALEKDAPLSRTVKKGRAYSLPPRPRRIASRQPSALYHLVFGTSRPSFIL